MGNKISTSGKGEEEGSKDEEEGKSVKAKVPAGSIKNTFNESSSEKKTYEKLCMSQYQDLQLLRKAYPDDKVVEQLCDLVLLGNLEACCLIANRRQSQADSPSQANSQSQADSQFQADLDDLLFDEPPTAASTAKSPLLPLKERLIQLLGNTAGPGKQDVAAAFDGKVKLSRVQEQLKQVADNVRSAIKQATWKSGVHDVKMYTDTLKAYSADVLPYVLPDDVTGDQKGPGDQEGPGDQKGPVVIAGLWVDIVGDVKTALSEVSIETLSGASKQDGEKCWIMCVLEAACQSGQTELVEKLLEVPKQSDSMVNNSSWSGIRSAILKCLATAWLGYQLTELRKGGAIEQQDDWLDYKHAGDRAKGIAAAVLKFVLCLEPAPDAAQSAGGGNGGGGKTKVQLQELPDLDWKSLKTEMAKRPVACRPLATGLMSIYKDLCMVKEEEDGEQKESVVNKGSEAGKLAVMACTFAVLSKDMQLLEETMNIVERKEVWPYLDLGLLLLLSEDYPRHAVDLLGKVQPMRVQEIDNVTPVAVWPGEYIITASHLGRDTFGIKTGENAGGRSLSTKDSDNFSKQRSHDPIIEAVLLKRNWAWFGFFFLFDQIREYRSPTVSLIRSVWFHAVLAFSLQGGPGSFAVGLAIVVLQYTLAYITRAVVLWVTLPLGLLWLLISLISPMVGRVSRFFRKVFRSMRGPVPIGWQCEAGPKAAEEQTVTGRLKEWWEKLNVPHYKLVNWVLDWGKKSNAVACVQLPFKIDFSKDDDTKLLKRLLRAHNLESSVFGTPVLEALIKYKWRYFAKHFITLQLLLHLGYMGVFLAYAWSVKNIEAIEGGGGRKRDNNGHLWDYAGSDRCELPAPSTTQMAYLIVLGVITLDYIIIEIRQMFFFGIMDYIRHTWDSLDLASVILMVMIICTHFVCAIGKFHVDSDDLRAMVASQVLLLFLRLLYYGMAFDQLGAFVSMVFAIIKDLTAFTFFLVVTFVGFVLAILVAQGTVSDTSEQYKAVFIKLYTIIFGDIGDDFVDSPWGGGEKAHDGVPPLNSLISVLVVVFMILVALVLLNLLIAIINESYNKIREAQRYEVLRNRALMIVSTEALLRGVGLWWLLAGGTRLLTWLLTRWLPATFTRRWRWTKMYPHFTSWLYTNLVKEPDAPSDGGRFLYVIRPEPPGATSKAGGEDEEQVIDGEDPSDDVWTQRLQKIHGYVREQGRRNNEMLIKELKKELKKELQKIAGKDTPSGDQQQGATVEIALQAVEPQKTRGDGVITNGPLGDATLENKADEVGKPPLPPRRLPPMPKETQQK